MNAFLGYASRTYAIPDDFRADWKSTYIQAAPPRESRGGIIMPIEGDRWIVTLLGGGRDYPPTDPAGFVEFTRSLRSSALYDVIAEAEPTSPVWHRWLAEQFAVPFATRRSREVRRAATA